MEQTHSVIFAGKSILTKSIEIWKMDQHKRGENRGENFGKIWEKSP